MVAMVKIGGVERELPPLKFKQLKKIWPRLRRVFEAQQGTVDPLDAVDSLIFIVAASLERSGSPLTIDQIEDELEPAEIEGLFPAINQLIEESGIKLAGEVLPAGGQAADPSTETSAT